MNKFGYKVWDERTEFVNCRLKIKKELLKKKAKENSD